MVFFRLCNSVSCMATPISVQIICFMCMWLRSKSEKLEDRICECSFCLLLSSNLHLSSSSVNSPLKSVDFLLISSPPCTGQVPRLKATDIRKLLCTVPLLQIFIPHQCLSASVLSPVSSCYCFWPYV